MEDLIPTKDDYILIDGELRMVTCKDLDGEVWYECKMLTKEEKDFSILSLVAIGNTPIIGDAIIGDIIESCNYFNSGYIDIFDPVKYYVYIPNYSVEYKRLELTKLAKKLYNIQDDFNGKLFLVNRRESK